MNQPQKNNSQTTDIRQKHINAIRQRLKQKREEYCKTRSDKNILGPGAIHNYLKEIYYRKLIIFLEVLKCRQSLMFQGFPAFLVTEDVLKSP